MFAVPAHRHVDDARALAQIVVQRDRDDPAEAGVGIDGGGLQRLAVDPVERIVQPLADAARCHRPGADRRDRPGRADAVVLPRDRPRIGGARGMHDAIAVTRGGGGGSHARQHAGQRQRADLTVACLVRGGIGQVVMGEHAQRHAIEAGGHILRAEVRRPPAAVVHRDGKGERAIVAQGQRPHLDRPGQGRQADGGDAAVEPRSLRADADRLQRQRGRRGDARHRHAGHGDGAGQRGNLVELHWESSWSVRGNGGGAITRRAARCGRSRRCG